MGAPKTLVLGFPSAVLLATVVGCSGEDVTPRRVPAPGESVWSGPDAFPELLAGDADTLFWVDATGQRLLGLSPSSSDAKVLEHAGTWTAAVAVDATDVYWIDQDPGRLDSYVLRRVPKTGGNSEEVARFATTHADALGDPEKSDASRNYYSYWQGYGDLAVDDTYAYVQNPSGDGSAITRVNKSTKTAEPLWTWQGPFEWVQDLIASDGALVVTGRFVYANPTQGQPEVRWYRPNLATESIPLDVGTSPLELAVLGSTVYLLGTTGTGDSEEWFVWRVDPSAGAAVVGKVEDFARDFTAAGDKLFYVDIDDDIVAFDPATLDSNVVVRGAQFSSVKKGLAASERSVYWATYHGVQKQAR